MWTSTWPLSTLPKDLFYCPVKFIAMIQQFHDGILSRFQNDGELFDPFYVTNGVK